MNLNYNLDTKSLEIIDDTDKFYGFYGLEPFKIFSYLFTDRNDWKTSLDLQTLTDEGAYFISSMYKNYGINIIGVSTVAVVSKEDCTKPKLSVGSVNTMTKELLNIQKNDKELINIFILHHSPWKDTDDSLGKDGITFLKSLASGVNDSLITFGHKHKGASNVRSYTDTSHKNALFSISPTPSLKKRDPDALRGYSIIKLHRSDDIITGCTIDHYEFSKDNYEIKDCRKYKRVEKKGWETIVE